MDRPLQNDIKDKFLPKPPNDNSSSDMSCNLSDPLERGEKVCSSGSTVNKVVSANESPHQSGCLEIGFESCAGNCEPNSEISFSGDCQQPNHISHLDTPHEPPSGNDLQETSTDVKPIESNVITQKSDCETDFENCDDSNMLNVSGACDAMHQGVQSNGCDLDSSPDKVLKEFVSCVTPKDVIEVQESCETVDFVESVNFLDGREKFSENSDGSQESYLGSCYCNNNSQMVSAEGDQTCTSSVNSIKDVVDQESSIPSAAKDSGTNFPVEQCNIKGKSYRSSDLHLVVENPSCNLDQFQELAVCVVDKIVEEATKSVIQLKNVDVKESNLQRENPVNELSDHIEQEFRKSLSEITDRVENTVTVLEGSELKCSTDRKCSFGDSSHDVSVESKNDMFEMSPYVNHDFQSNFHDTKEGLAPVVCNGNIASLKQCNCADDLMAPDSLSGFDVSVTNCTCQVEDYVIEGSEAKVNSSNDCLKSCKNVNVKYSSNIDKMTESLGQKTEVVKVASYVDKSSDNLVCTSNQDSEAKVECSNNLSLGKSLIVADSFSSPSVVCGREIDTSYVAASVLSTVDSKDISVATNQDIVEEKVCGDLASFQGNSDETKLGLAQEDLAKDDKNAVSDENVLDSHLENEKHISENRKKIVEEDNHTQCDLVTPISEKDECTSEKPETTGEQETAASGMKTPITESYDCAAGKKETVEEGTAKNDVVTAEENESAIKETQIVEEKYSNDTTDKNETVEKEERVVEAIPANPSSDENENDKSETVAEEREFTAEKREAIVEEETLVGEEGTTEKEKVVVEEVPADSNTEENEGTQEKLETIFKAEGTVTEFTAEIREEIVEEDILVKEEGRTTNKEGTAVAGETPVEEKGGIAEMEEIIADETPVLEEGRATEKEGNAVEEETPVEDKEGTAEKEETIAEETPVLEEGRTVKKEENTVEGETPLEEKEGTAGKEESVVEETCKPIMVTCNSENPETPSEKMIASPVSVSSHDETGSRLELMSGDEEPNEVNIEEDLGASCRLLSFEENTTDSLLEVTETPLSATDSNGGNAQARQLIVPIVNVCPPIVEETYDGITDDESEISHATSDSESDSNVKIVKPLCDGINTINYKPLLEEDSNDRSTLSLISELDEASVKEDIADNEQWEDESVSLILGDDVPNSQVVQRVKGRRIKMVSDLEGNSSLEEESSEPEDKTSLKYAEKIKDIREALKSSDSLERLRELARCDGGLLNDEIRKEAWLRLLGIDDVTANLPLPPINMEELRAHKSYTQVVLDVNRSLRRFPTKFSATERADLQNQLTEIILRVLMKREDLSYYQGYHDVAVTTLLVAGKDTAFHILERISVTYLAECMQPTFERTSYLLNYIYPLIRRINDKLADRMDRVEVGTMFCLPWFLTWYGYSLNLYEDIVRLFDYFLASPPLASIYLAAVIVCRRSAEVLAADPDQATVHALLSRIPETLPFEDLLEEATDLYRNYPPDDIDKEVKERCDRLREAEKAEEEQRRQFLSRRQLQRRHSMPTTAARQVRGWYYFERILGFPPFQRSRIIHFSATIFLGMIAWHLRDDLYHYL